jgi:ABC-type branched-subunit amino acid transport system substrate-binding protein
MPSSTRRALLGLPLLFMSTRSALAASANTLTIGRVTPSSSPIFRELAQRRRDGADAYIAEVNAKGGIAGRKLVVVDRDDGYNAEQAARETALLVEKDNVLAMLGAFGTPTLPKVMDVLEAARVPLVGAVDVRDDARHPERRFVFPVRAGTFHEASAVVKHQTTIGLKRFVVLTSTESYGPPGAAAYGAALKAAGLPFQHISFSASDDPVQVATRLRDAAPEAVLLSVLPKSLAAVKRHYAALGGRATMIGHSSMAMDDFRKELGPLSGEMVFSQIMPSPYGGASPLAQEFRRLLAVHRPDAKPSYNGIEGFLEAKVLETINHLDFGGPLVTYGKGVRAGSTFVDLVLLSRDGALVV